MHIQLVGIVNSPKMLTFMVGFALHQIYVCACNSGLNRNGCCRIVLSTRIKVASMRCIQAYSAVLLKLYVSVVPFSCSPFVYWQGSRVE